MRLVVAAFWVEDDDAAVRDPLGAERIKGSGSAVTFTPDQTTQVGLCDSLRRFHLYEAVDYLTLPSEVT